MAKFSGVVGFVLAQVEVRPGVYKDQVVERPHIGDVVRDTRRNTEVDKVNFDFGVSNSISIVADAYAMEHFFAIRYISWAGALWTVTDVEVQRPRLLLRLGGIYNGPKAPVS